MIISKTKMANHQTEWYIQILEWVRDNAIVWTSFLIAWKGLDLGFKFLKEGREGAIRHIVQDEINKGVSLKLDNLSEKVESLGNAIFKLNTKL